MAPSSLSSALLSLLPDAAQARRQALTLLLALAIVLSHFLLGGNDDQRLLEVGFLGLAGAVIVAGGRLFATALLAPPIRYALLTFFALGLASALMAFSPRHALIEVLLLLSLLAVALAVAGEMASDHVRALRIVLGLLVLGCGLYMMQVLLPWLASMVTRRALDMNSLAPGFSNYRLFNHAQTISLPLLVLAVCLASPGRRAWVLAVAAFWCALLFAVSGRGTMLALGAGCLIALLLWRRHALAFCRTLAQVAALGLLIYWVTCLLIPFILDIPPVGELTEVLARTAASPDGKRGQLWRWCLEFMASDPWFGIGPMHYAHDLSDVSYAAHPHNWVLQLGAEWGIPAMLCACLAVALALRALVRSARSIAEGDTRNRTLLSAWTVIGVAIVVDGLVSGNIVMPVSQLLIALYIGCATGWAWSLQGPLPASSITMRRATGTMVALATLGLLAGIALELPVSAHVQYLQHPRLWLNGYF